MKKLMMFAAVVSVAAVSLATVQIDWGNTAFLSGSDSGSGDPEQSTFATQDGYKIIWDLVWTSTGSAASLGYNAETGELDGYGEGYKLLSQRIWTGGTTINVTDENGNALSPATMNIDIANAEGGNLVYKTDTTLGAGKIYSAVFQYIGDDTAGEIFTALTPLFGYTEYTESPVLSSCYFGEEPQDMMTKLSSIGTYGSDTPPTEVPEPATMGLLGLGALAMVLRRKLAK